jgi:hypothetical protein
MGDLAMNEPVVHVPTADEPVVHEPGNGRTRLLLRFADLGVASYAAVRRIGRAQPLATWALDGAEVAELAALVAGALPVPGPDESPAEAAERAVTVGPLAEPDAEARLAAAIGRLIPEPVWRLLVDTVNRPDARAALHISPSPMVARVPFALAAAPDGARLIELVDVATVAPTHAVQRAPRPNNPAADGAVLILDPRVPGATADSPLGSVLGRPDPHGRLTRHFGDLPHRRPDGAPLALFRRTDLTRDWLAAALRTAPARLLFVGHVTAADGAIGRADRAALHLCCRADTVGRAEPIGPHRPLAAMDLLTDPDRWPMPPRVAIIACEAAGDYGFAEATGLIAALVSAGARLVTGTLWPLPTGRGLPEPVRGAMTEMVIAVDTAHRAADALGGLGGWQREMLARWRSGDPAANPVWWAALTTTSVDGAR